MTSTVKARYDVYINAFPLGIAKAAEAVLLEDAGLLTRVGFRYTREYLESNGAFALDPVQLPLTAKEFNFSCHNGAPGILDDYLPDAWGRKVLAKLAFYKRKVKLNQFSCIDMLSELGNSRIGALQWVPVGENPRYEFGAELSKLKDAESAAQYVEMSDYASQQIDELSLLYLANAGTGVGGARPKALLCDGAKAYLAKFNRLSLDSYNNARVELACLKLAKLAGLDVFAGKIVDGINGREVLLLDRFDIHHVGELAYRHHLITINALLKEPATQRNYSGVFRYDDICHLIRQYSCDVERDLQQLLRMMLFNRAINNTDNHERNFSFISTESGYRLAPAYDMVPTLSTGEYPAAGFQYNPQPPLPSEVMSLGKVFGLPKTKVKAIAEQMIEAIKQWPTIAENIGVCEKDRVALSRVINW